MLPEIDPARM